MSVTLPALTSLTLAASSIIVVETDKQYIGFYVGTTTVTYGSTNINNVQLYLPGILYLNTKFSYMTTSQLSTNWGYYPSSNIIKIPGLDATNSFYIAVPTIMAVYKPNTNIQNLYQDYVNNFNTNLISNQPQNVW